MKKSLDEQRQTFEMLVVAFRSGIGENYRSSCRDSGPSEVLYVRQRVVDFFKESDPLLDLEFLYVALCIMSNPINNDERLNALLHKSGFELNAVLKKISESKNKVEDRKLFGVCFQNHEGKMQHAVFDEAGLRWWLKDKKVEIDERYFVDTKIGETYSFIGRYDFIFWRMIPDRKE